MMKRNQQRFESVEVDLDRLAREVIAGRAQLTRKRGECWPTSSVIRPITRRTTGASPCTTPQSAA
jgi:hypothetical protein